MKKEEIEKKIDEIKRKYEEERNEKAKIYKLKKGNVKREFSILKEEVEQFKDQLERENEYFLERLQEMPEADLEDVICFTPEEREEQVNENSKLLKISSDPYKFIKWLSECITKDCTCNEDYFDTEKLLGFFNSYFGKDFEEILQYYKEKFDYEE